MLLREGESATLNLSYPRAISTQTVRTNLVKSKYDVLWNVV